MGNVSEDAGATDTVSVKKTKHVHTYSTVVTGVTQEDGSTKMVADERCRECGTVKK